MKLQVRLTSKDGQQQAEVEVTQTPRGVELREAEALLAWAEERGVSRVVYRYPDLSNGVPHTRTYTRCRNCRFAVEQSSTCRTCGELMMIGVGIGKAEEWEYLAQYAENMSTRWAQLAIELQARAATAEHDPIEIEVLPSDKYYDLDVMLERLLNNKRLYTASSEQLDAWASTLGLQRSNKGGFAESDESLRWRIQAHVDRKQQKIATVDLNAALNLKPGQVLTLGGSDVKITNVKYDSNGTAEISYTLI